MEQNLPNHNPSQQNISVSEPNLRQNQTSTQQPNSNKFPTRIILLIIVLMFGVVGLFAYQNYQLKQQLANKQQPNPAPDPLTNVDSPSETSNTTSYSPADEPSSSQINETVSEDAVPQVNTLYWGTYQGRNNLFITNSRLNKYYDGGVEKTSPMIGMIVGRSPIDYKNLSEPKRVLSIDEAEDIVSIQNFNFQKNTLYVVLNSTTTPSNSYPDITQKAYKVNLTNLSNNEIWSHQIGSETYPKAGPATIDQVMADKYIIFSLGICYACEGFDPHGSVVLNIETGKEKYLGEVDNFQFDLNTNSISYQNLHAFEESCEPGMGCDNGKKTVYKPSGETATETLP